MTSTRPPFRLGRRALLGGAGAALAAALTGCGGNRPISTDPAQLVLWYWNRSISPTLLGQAAEQIPGTDRRLRADVIGGTFDTKLRTVLAGGSYIPDLTAVNSNCSLYFPSEQRFVDFNDFGAAEVQGDFYEWKWAFGTSPTGRQCFWPMDIGPTGFFYRADLFEQAGLPADPEAVAAASRTWEDWIDLGRTVREKLDANLVNAGSSIFTQYLNASPQRFFDSDDQPVFEAPDSAVRKAWDTAVAAIQAGVTGGLSVTTDQNSAWVSGKTVGNIEAVWWAQILADTAPDTAGKWRLAAQPERPGNSGGSFLAVPTSSKDPQAAYEFIRWLTTPAHQAASYNELQLFPSTPASFDDPAITAPEGTFFGDQDPLQFFATQAETVPTTFVSTYEAQCGAFAKKLTSFESGGGDPEQAWDEAVAETNQVLAKRGVTR